MSFEQDINQWQKTCEEIIKEAEIPGLLPSPPDPRDYSIEDIPLATPVLPPKLYLQPSPIILDQGSTGYCAGAAAAGVANAFYHSIGEMPDERGFSMNFLYWLSKEIDGIPHVSGTYLRTVLKIMHERGCGLERYTPYTTSRSVITAEALEHAKKYRIESYARLRSSRDLKQALGKGCYILIGTLVTRGNWSRVYLSTPSGPIYGGHATHLFGYDDDLVEIHTGYYAGQNSWGKRAHDNGRFFLPYDYHRMRHEGQVKFLEAWAVQFATGKKKVLPDETMPSPIQPRPQPQIREDILDNVRQQLINFRDRVNNFIRR